MIQRNQRSGNVEVREDTDEQDNDVLDDSVTPMQSSLRIDDVQGAFVVLSIGLLLGASCCILEICISW